MDLCLFSFNFLSFLSLSVCSILFLFSVVLYAREIFSCRILLTPHTLTGTLPGSSDLHPYTVSVLPTSQVTLAHLTHGTRTFTTVACTNAAGLHTTASSDGLTILLTPPTSDSAHLAISSPLLTAYAPSGPYLPSGNVTLRWYGFLEPAGTPLSYEVCVGGAGCVEVGEALQLMVGGVGGDYPSGEVSVAVTAVNRAGLRSTAVQGRINLQTNPPLDTGQHWGGSEG